MPHSTNRIVNIDEENLSYFCRGCKQQVRGIPLTNPQYRMGVYSDDEAWLICRCPTGGCELSFVIFDQLNSQIRQTFPLSNFRVEDYHNSIPERVRADLAEAERCLHASSYKGSVTMFRRAVQNVVLDKIKDKEIQKKKLWEQIDKLFDQGFITKYLKDTAHEIRHFGNFGAHPSDDALDDTTREDAGIIEQLTLDLVQAIYITPSQTEELKSKRSKE